MKTALLELRQMYTIAPPLAFTTNMIICVQIKIRTSAFQTGGDINTHMLPYNPLSPFSTKFRNIRIQEHLLHFIIIISMWSEMTFVKSTKNKTICQNIRLRYFSLKILYNKPSKEYINSQSLFICEEYISRVPQRNFLPRKYMQKIFQTLMLQNRTIQNHFTKSLDYGELCQTAM